MLFEITVTKTNSTVINALAAKRFKYKYVSGQKPSFIVENLPC